MKTCKICNVELTKENCYLRPNGTPCTLLCKTHYKANVKKRADENPEKIFQQSKRYRDSHKEELSAKKKAEYERNKEHIIKRVYVWQSANPTKVRRYKKKWNQKNPAICSAAVAKYRINNPEKVKETHRNSVARRIDQVLESNKKRAESIKERTIERFSPIEIAERDKWICHLCNFAISPNELSIDHLIPISKGGEHSRSNVKAAHLSCNCSRGNKDLPAAA